MGHRRLRQEHRPLLPTSGSAPPSSGPFFSPHGSRQPRRSVQLGNGSCPCWARGLPPRAVGPYSPRGGCHPTLPALAQHTPSSQVSWGSTSGWSYGVRGTVRSCDCPAPTGQLSSPTPRPLRQAPSGPTWSPRRVHSVHCGVAWGSLAHLLASPDCEHLDGRVGSLLPSRALMFCIPNLCGTGNPEKQLAGFLGDTIGVGTIFQLLNT